MSARRLTVHSVELREHPRMEIGVHQPPDERAVALVQTFVEGEIRTEIVLRPFECVGVVAAVGD
jgi:hypothetical protein